MRYILLSLLCMSMCISCKNEVSNEFMPFDGVAAYNFLNSREEYSQWAKLIRHAGLDNSMNLSTVALTCFVVGNNEMTSWLNANGYDKVEDMEPEQAVGLLRYHIMEGRAFAFSEFRNGRFPIPTASGDYHTAMFVDGEQDGVFIDGTAKLSKWDITVTNGVIHVLDGVLTPISGTMYDMLGRDSRYSIFKAIVDLTQTRSHIDQMIVPDFDVKSRKSMLVVSDEVYNQYEIMSVDDLISKVSASDSDYPNPTNPLNRYARYHMLAGDFITTELSKRLSTYYVDTKGIILNTELDDATIHLQNISGDLVFNPQSATQGAKLFGTKYNLQLKNGVIHELDRPIYISEPPQLTIVYDFADYIALPWLLTYEYYRTEYLTDQKLNLTSQQCQSAITWQSLPAEKADAMQYHISTTGAYSLRTYWKCCFDDAIVFNLGSVGWVNFQLPSIPKGTYNIKLSYKKEKNFGGNFQIYIDGQKVGSVIQGYVPATGIDAWPEELVGKYTFTETAKHSFKCAIVKGGRVSIDVLILEPVI